MDTSSVALTIIGIGTIFSLAPFDSVLQPMIEETLREQGKDHWRRRTMLIPRLVIWLVLVLSLRRDLNYDQAFN